MDFHPLEKFCCTQHFSMTMFIINHKREEEMLDGQGDEEK